MKTQFTPDFNRAEWILYNHLSGQGLKLRIGQVKGFRLDADTPENEILGYAQDYINDLDLDTDVEFTHEDRYISAYPN